MLQLTLNPTEDFQSDIILLTDKASPGPSDNDHQGPGTVQLLSATARVSDDA